jgi:uncharacterized protein YjiK
MHLQRRSACLGLVLARLLLRSPCVLADPPSDALAGYHLQFQTRVRGVADNLSGLAFDPASGRLLAVVNRPAILLVLDRDNRVQRSIALRGFIDTEGVAVHGDGRVAVTEEALNQIAAFAIPAAGRDAVDHAQARILRLDLFARGNSGCEGLTWHARHRCLWLVKARAPRGLYSVCTPDRRSLLIRDHGAWLEDADAGSDLPGIAVDPVTGHLLLSDESAGITEIDLHRRVLEHRALHAQGSPHPPQPEGIALDGKGHLTWSANPIAFSGSFAIDTRPAQAVDAAEVSRAGSTMSACTVCDVSSSCSGVRSRRAKSSRSRAVSGLTVVSSFSP